MLLNTGSLIATTGVTSVLGFAYWWFAARRFSPEAVGIASTSTSAMMLIGGLCTLGFSTLLLTELPRKPKLTGPLIATALLVVGVTAAVASVAFAYIAPFLSAQYQPLRANVTDVIILTIGVALAAMTLVFDQAMIGLLRGELQFWRNVLFSSAKVLGLFVVGFWFSRSDGMSIYAAWAFSSLLSMAVILAYAVYKRILRVRELTPRISLLKNLGRSAFQHHLLNTTLQAPMQILPLLVTALLSVHMTAWFFTAWQIVNIVFLIPSSLTTVLHAMNSARPEVLARKARTTLALSTLVCVLVNIVLLFAPRLVLSPFGADYVLHADWTLRILSFAAFPLIIKSHYISICRIHDRITPALRGMVPGGVFEVAVAAVGAHFGGLTGLSLGWVLAVSLESLFMVKTVYMAVWPRENTLVTHAEDQDIQMMDTVKIPALAILAEPEQGMLA
jgi:O-antigen/teichoic acid export membrane protein